MAYIDLTTTFILDKFFTYIDADNLAENDAHIKDSFAVDHNWNAASIDGTHKNNIITGAKISKTVVSSDSQQIIGGSTWTPSAGIYQLAGIPGVNGVIYLEIYISGGWRKAGSAVSSTFDDNNIQGIFIFDGSNMRISTDGLSDINATVWYQTF